METQQFLDLVNNCTTQYYACHPSIGSLTFAAQHAEDKGDTLEVNGCWINVATHEPLAYDTINIQKVDLPAWTLNSKYPGKKDA